MGLEYVIEPEFGRPASEVLWDQRIDNSKIHVYYNGRELHPPLYTNDIFLSLPTIKVTPVAMLSEEIRTPTGNITVEKDIPVNNLVREINPFYQIIYKIVAESGHLTKEGIFKALVFSRRVLPDTRQAWHAVTDDKQGIVKILERHATLTFYVEDGVKFYTKGRPLRNESPHLITLHKGYDPVAYLMMDFLKRSGSARTDEVEDYFMNNLGWLRQPSSVYAYLKSLEIGELYGVRVSPHVKEGNIKRTYQNYWEYRYPLTPWGEASIPEKEPKQKS